MTDLKKFYQHSSHYLLGQVGFYLIGFISFPVFTRVFSVSEYGLISLTLNTIAIATVFSKLGLQQSVLRFYPEYTRNADAEAKKRYYSTLFWSATAIGAAVMVVFVLGLWGLPSQWFSPMLRKLMLLAAVLVLVRAMFSIVMNFWRAEGKTTAYNLVSVGTKAGTVAAICILLFTWRRTPVAFFVGTIAVELVLLIWVTVVLCRRNLLSFGTFETHFFKLAVAFGLPFIGYELAALVLDTGDRFLVEYFLGSNQLGYYAAAYNVSSYIQQCVAVPLNLAAFPIYMGVYVNKGKEETQAFLSRGLDHFLLIAFCLLGGVVVTGRDAIVILSTAKFQEAARLLPTLVAGLLIYSLGIYLNAGMLIHKKTYEMARYITYSCALNMVLNVWLIPRMGLQGAALATLLACAFLMALMGWRSHQVLPLRFNFVGMLRYILAASAAALVSMRLELQHPVLNFLVKGTAFVVLYAGFLWLIDGNFRKLASSGAKLLRARREANREEPACAEGSVEAGAWKPVSDEVQSSVDSLPAGR